MVISKKEVIFIMSLIKTPIYLTLEQKKSLKEEAEDQHVSLSELVRKYWMNAFNIWEQGFQKEK